MRTANAVAAAAGPAGGCFTASSAGCRRAPNSQTHTAGLRRRGHQHCIASCSFGPPPQPSLFQCCISPQPQRLLPAAHPCSSCCSGPGLLLACLVAGLVAQAAAGTAAPAAARECCSGFGGGTLRPPAAPRMPQPGLQPQQGIRQQHPECAGGGHHPMMQAAAAAAAAGRHSQRSSQSPKQAQRPLQQQESSSSCSPSSSRSSSSAAAALSRSSRRLAGHCLRPRRLAVRARRPARPSLPRRAAHRTPSYSAP